MRRFWSVLPLTLLVACEGAGPAPQAVVLPDRDSPGARLVADRCGRCHAPPDPARHTAREWPSVVERMRVHMVRQANEVLTDEETALVLEYLKRHARPVS